MAQIIPKIIASVEHNWQKELASSFTDPVELLRYLNLPVEDYAAHIEARRLFPMRVPRSFAALMKPQDPGDPLLNQVFPMAQEFTLSEGFSDDPLLEHDTAGQGILHKYRSRVLLIVRGGCAVNCRYCFRRHFPYSDNAINRRDFEQVLTYLISHTEINEVIFSGGDPLMAKDSQLAWMAEQIAQITHIRRLRIHTRLPVVIPNRVDSDFVNWFTQSPLQKILVIHANHPNEVSALLKDKLLILKQAGVTLLNQAVLLKGINDNADVLENLHEALFAAGVLPYYLHLLDKVQGAAHYAVSDNEARKLMAELIKRQPGFLVPKLVREIGGQPGKTPMDLHLHP
ncbi:EF-P beta-lysylation protein EpmB [Alteromonas ponticola]|uniref:L-lysine 2,3-aminomutase n=1 Tax=Alteromonas aquimaris TaxID=2998417 RepID=A0ABT3P9I6_9ALTE|nr:EF-P beta-lysylation protein EpmB [Alteromonas aquimaris]MCW8109370.1 EF-P beta-lysylation protein EpmB [Alteromonas aquimaris]